MNVPVVAHRADRRPPRWFPSRARRTGPGLDVAGMAASAAAWSALTYGLIEAGQHGWGEHDRARSRSAAGIALLAGFLRLGATARAAPRRPSR